MMTYIHELPDWPRFVWSNETLAAPLAAARHQQGRLIGQMQALGFTGQGRGRPPDADGRRAEEQRDRRREARRRPGPLLGRAPPGHGHRRLEARGPPCRRRGRDDARRHAAVTTSRSPTERLFGWHASLFPTGRSGMHPIKVGAWRDDSTAPMQVVSGPVGSERVHFEAPAAARLDDEMRAFPRLVQRRRDDSIRC